jgi:hypothetical protein
VDANGDVDRVSGRPGILNSTQTNESGDSDSPPKELLSIIPHGSGLASRRTSRNGAAQDMLQARDGVRDAERPAHLFGGSERRKTRLRIWRPDRFLPPDFCGWARGIGRRAESPGPEIRAVAQRLLFTEGAAQGRLRAVPAL